MIGPRWNCRRSTAAELNSPTTKRGVYSSRNRTGNAPTTAITAQSTASPRRSLMISWITSSRRPASKAVKLWASNADDRSECPAASTRHSLAVGGKAASPGCSPNSPDTLHLRHQMTFPVVTHGCSVVSKLHDRVLRDTIGARSRRTFVCSGSRADSR